MVWFYVLRSIVFPIIVGRGGGLQVWACVLMFVHIEGGWGPMQHWGISPQGKCLVLGFPPRGNLVVEIPPKRNQNTLLIFAGGEGYIWACLQMCMQCAYVHAYCWGRLGTNAALGDFSP